MDKVVSERCGDDGYGRETVLSVAWAIALALWSIIAFVIAGWLEHQDLVNGVITG